MAPREELISSAVCTMPQCMMLFSESELTVVLE